MSKLDLVTGIEAGRSGPLTRIEYLRSWDRYHLLVQTIGQLWELRYGVEEGSIVMRPPEKGEPLKWRHVI